MGNACSCMRSSSSSSSLLQDLELSAEFGNQICSDFTEETVNQLVLRMDELIHNLRTGAHAQTQPSNQESASSSSSSSAVSAATGTARQIVKTLSHRIEREIPKRKRCGKTSTETLKKCGMAALDNHTAKFVSEVLGKIENVPYVGMAASLVVFALEHVHQTSANDELRLRLLQHMFTLVKRMNSVHDSHHREKFHDMILVILNITISIVNQIQSGSVSRVLFADLDAADFQKLERDLSDKFKELELDVQLSTLQNVPQIATPSIQSYSPTAVGIDDDIEEVKAKLKMGDKSRRVVAIFGMGGIGKTTLATEVINSLSSDIEAAYAYCRLDMDIKSTNIVDLQQQLLRNAFKWNVQVDSSNDGRTKILQKLEGNAHASSSETSKPLFLFIDNALKEDEVRELLPRDRLCLLPLHSRILVTTRNLNEIQALMKMQEFESEAHNVGDAENQQAKKMLCHYALGNQDSAFPEDVEVDDLLEICGGIPLVIEMAGKRLHGSRDMAYSCREITQSIRSTIKGGWKHKESDRMVDFVYEQLSKHSQTLLLEIASFYLWRTREEVEYMLEDPTLIQELKDAALLSEDEEGSLKMHDIIRERLHVLSDREGGRRISDEHAWEMAKADPEIWKTIKGVQLNRYSLKVTQLDFDVITECTGITTLILSSRPYVEPLKLHLWPSLRIVFLSGRIIVNVDQLSPTNLVTLKLHDVMVEDTPKFYQRIGDFHKLCCLELVHLAETRAELGSFRELSSLRRLRLTRSHLQRLPGGFENLVGLQSFKLDDCRNLWQLPQGLGKCSHLKELDLWGCSRLEKAVDTWQHLTSLQQLSMTECSSLKFISEDFGRLSKLKRLDIWGCKMLQKLPNSFGGLSSLEFLDMTGCKNLECLCESFCKVSKLKELKIIRCEKLGQLPRNFEDLSSLEVLHMRGCRVLECLCESFCKLSKLKILDISNCEKLQQLPDSFGNLSSLQYLDMHHCKDLKYLCDSFGKLSKLNKLHMSGCEMLRKLPNNFGDLSSLEFLNMEACKMLECLCESFGNLSKLQVLFINDCEKLQQLPEGFGNLLSLEKLYMNNCSSLECLCGNFGKLSKLKQLHMANCESLKSLDETVVNLSSLERMTLNACIGLHKLPETLQGMSYLRNLKLKGCKNIHISAEGLPCSLTVIDIRECQCNEFEFTNLLRMQSLFLVVYSPSSRFQECYHYHCLQNNSLPFALPFSGDILAYPWNVAEAAGPSAVGAWLWKGGGSSGFMRMEGNELVWEEAKTSAVTRSGAKIALLITGLWPYLTEKCREALQRAAEEGYEIVWIDCGMWRWNRYVSRSKSEEFRGDVEWDDDDKRRMRKMLQMISEGCTKRLWTSLFPKNCLVLVFIIVCCCLRLSKRIIGAEAMLVKGRCRCRCRCRGEEETEGQETFLDVKDVRKLQTDDEMMMHVLEEMKRIEIPGFGFGFPISSKFCFDVLDYLSKVLNFFK